VLHGLSEAGQAAEPLEEALCEQAAGPAYLEQQPNGCESEQAAAPVVAALSRALPSRASQLVPLSAAVVRSAAETAVVAEEALRPWLCHRAVSRDSAS